MYDGGDDGPALGHHARKRLHGVPPPSIAVFAQRIGRAFVLAASIVGPALGIGMVGYRLTEQWTWLDCFHNASMILSGMGPVDQVKSAGGKLFAGCYALFSGVVFHTVAAVVFAPVFHRVMHHLHWELGKEDGRR